MSKYRSITDVLEADEEEMGEIIKVAGMPKKKQRQ